MCSGSYSFSPELVCFCEFYLEFSFSFLTGLQGFPPLSLGRFPAIQSHPSWAQRQESQEDEEKEGQRKEAS